MGEAAEHGHLRLLVDRHGIDHGRDRLEALWGDLESAGLLEDVERAAVLTDMGALKAVVGAMDHLPSLTSKVFAPGERDDAVVWLQS